MSSFNRVFHMLPGVHYRENRRRAAWDRIHPHHPFPRGRYAAPRAPIGVPPSPGLHWVPYTGWVDQNGRPAGHPVAITGAVTPPAPPTGAAGTSALGTAASLAAGALAASAGDGAASTDGTTPDPSMGFEGAFNEGLSHFLTADGLNDDVVADGFHGHGGGGGGHGGGGGRGGWGGGWGGGGWGWGYPYPYYDEAEVIGPSLDESGETVAPVVIVRRGSPWGMRG